jgi:malate dehydrogenase (oxaloacetate-decarboxylating)(NADP+)
VLYCEGEDERVLRATQVVLDEGLALPVLIGRPAVVAMRLKRLSLRILPGRDFELVNPESDPRYHDICQDYYHLTARKGVSPTIARVSVLRSTTLIGTLLLQRGDADALICGTYGQLHHHLEHVENVIGRAPGANLFATMNVLLLRGRTLFVCDTYVNDNPSAEQIAEITQLAAATVHRFGIVPKVALMSHSNFGSSRSASAGKMRRAREILARQWPDLEVEGEMHGDAALSEEIRNVLFPDCSLKGEANLLIMPNLDAANIAYSLLKATGGEGVTVGPILLGAARPAHILTPTATVRRLVNMTALAAVEAGQLTSAMAGGGSREEPRRR